MNAMQNGMTTLMLAAKGGSVKVMQLILNLDGTDAQALDKVRSSDVVHLSIPANRAVAFLLLTSICRSKISCLLNIFDFSRVGEMP